MAKTYRRKWLHKDGIIRQRGTTYQVEIDANGQRDRETAPTVLVFLAFVGFVLTTVAQERPSLLYGTVVSEERS